MSASATYGHVFHDIAITGHARAVFGDVHVSCPDFLEHLTPVQKRRALLNALFYEDMHRRSAHIERARPQTCEWIWSTSFAAWLAEADPNSLFWIFGKPGCGKSTLMKYLTTSPKTRSRLPRPRSSDKAWSISHFFFDFRAAKRMPNTEQGLLRTLLYQVVSELALERNVLARYELTLENIITAEDIDSMIEMLAQVVSTEQLSVLFFVDGLDEYEYNIRELIQLLQMIRARTGLRLCLASRPEPAIQAMIGSSPQMEVQVYNSSGIESFVRNSIDEVAANVGIAKLMPLEPFIAFILERAGGVFLWVHFAVNTFLEHLVLGCMKTEIKRELELLPTQLHSMYDRILDQIPEICRSEASMILLLIESASHAVTLELLYQVWMYIYAAPNSGATGLHTLSVEQFQLRLRGFLGGLLDFQVHFEEVREVSIDLKPLISAKEVRVRLIHETLRAYMKARSLAMHWMKPALASRFPDNVWLRVYTQVLAQADASFGTATWSIVDKVSYVYKLQRVRHGQPWHVAQAELDRLMDNHGQVQPSHQNVAGLVYQRILPHAILFFDLVARSSALYDGPLFEHYSSALRSPLVLLYDMIKPQRCQLGLLMKYKDHDWAYDLAFAAARSWSAYVLAHIGRVAMLPPAERNYLLICACGGSASFATSPSGTGHQDDLNDATVAIVSVLLQFCPQFFVDSTHVAYLMQERFSAYAPKLLPVLQEAYMRTQSQPPTFVRVDQSVWRGNYPSPQYEGAHVLELLSNLDVKESVFNLWLEFLSEVGVDLRTWRDGLGNNLMLRTLDTAYFYWPNEFTNWLVIRRAFALDKCGVHIPLNTFAGKCTLMHLHNLRDQVRTQSYGVLAEFRKLPKPSKNEYIVTNGISHSSRLLNALDELVERAEHSSGTEQQAYTRTSEMITAARFATMTEKNLTSTSSSAKTSNLRQQLSDTQQVVGRMTRQWAEDYHRAPHSREIEIRRRKITQLELEIAAQEDGEWQVEGTAVPPEVKRDQLSVPSMQVSSNDSHTTGSSRTPAYDTVHVEATNPGGGSPRSLGSRRSRLWSTLRNLKPKSIG